MTEYQQLLLRPEWKVKREECILRDHYKCMLCNNFKLLNNLSIGYIVKSEKTGELRIGTEFIGSKRAWIQGLDFDDRVALTNIGTTFHYIPDKANIEFNNTKNYIAYFDVNKEDISGIVRALAEVDLPDSALKFLVSKQSNPFRQKDFFEKAFMIYARGLQVHHTYYILNEEPWNYDLRSLQTLCKYCHEEIHNEAPISIHDKDKRLIGHSVFKPYDLLEE